MKRYGRGNNQRHLRQESLSMKRSSREFEGVFLFMKECNICHIIKPLDDYHTSRDNKDGKMYKCKACVKVYHASRKEYNSAYKKEHLVKNFDKINEYKKNYYIKNKEFVDSQNKKYADANKEKLKEYRQRYYSENSEKIAEYKYLNRESIRESKRKTQAKYKQNPFIKFKFAITSRCRLAFKHSGYSKNTKTAKILGCDYETLIKHMERQFKKGMTWDNRGHGKDCWHIDHRIPLASAKTEQELIELCHYTNLQPLWSTDNLKKGTKMPAVQTKLVI